VNITTLVLKLTLAVKHVTMMVALRKIVDSELKLHDI